jgi:hypothetical protein
MCRDFVKSFICNLEQIGERVENLLVITRHLRSNIHSHLFPTIIQKINMYIEGKPRPIPPSFIYSIQTPIPKRFLTQVQFRPVHCGNLVITKVGSLSVNRLQSHADYKYRRNRGTLFLGCDLSLVVLFMHCP